MIPKIDFEYIANKARVKKEASYSIWRGLFLAIFTGFAIAVVLIFALIPGFAEAFDDVATGISTLFILVILTVSGILGWIIIGSAKRSQQPTIEEKKDISYALDPKNYRKIMYDDLSKPL